MCRWRNVGDDRCFWLAPATPNQGDKGVPSREAGAVDLPAHHLYACEASSPELRRHLAFRDFLRRHREWRTRLNVLKLKLSVDPGITRGDYQQRKCPLVVEILDIALAEGGGKS